MQASKVSELTVSELRSVIREEVRTMLQIMLLDDPDRDLSIKPEFREQIIQSMADFKNNGKIISAQETAKRLGLEW